MNGILNVYKEPGFTSHDVVAKLRGICKQKKIGHTGTLDPEASGVLPVCLGNATKLCDLLTDKDKEYRAVLLLGVETDTQDTTGQILAEKEVNAGEEDVRSANLSVIVSFTHVLPVVYAGTVGGIADTDPALLEMAKVYRLPLGKRLRYIWLPGMFPSFCESCIAAMGMCWKSGVSAEVIGLPDHSVGDALYRAKITISTPEVFAWTLVIVLLSATLSTLAAWALRRAKRALCGEVEG